MKKTSLISFLIVSVTLLFASLAVAAQPSPACDATPTGLVCPTDADSVNFDWDTTVCPNATTADKYSVDISYASADGLTLIETSYGTSDRTDGLPMSASQLEVPLADLAALGIPCGQDIEAKVKALEMTGNRKYGKANEKNPWSFPSCKFQIACP